MVFAYFTVLISVGYKFLEGPFASRSQLNHPKMCKNQKYAIPVVHSTVYTLLMRPPFWECINGGMDYWTGILEWTTGMTYIFVFIHFWLA